MRGLRLAVVVSVGVALGALSGSVPLSAQQEIVARGNQAYQEGSYVEAVEAYEAVMEAGFTSAGLEYNLGNAYFKAGELGRAILHWERALKLAPGDEDARANLELARSLTVDSVEPMPRFWLVSVISWWVGLLPRGWLLGVVALGWLGLTGGIVVRILGRAGWVRPAGRWAAVGGTAMLVLFGPSLLVRTTGLGLPERAVVLADQVQVRSAPSSDEDATLFEIHEGTRVKVDQRAGEWVEIVLDDGKVGWVPGGVLEVI